MPPTPSEFLAQAKESSDRSLSCAQLMQKVRRTFVMREAVDRVFGTSGPVLMRESGYSSTNGIGVKSGGLTTGFSTTSTFGGGNVYVYSDLSYRAKQINDAQMERRNELAYLMKVNACSEMRFNGSEDYSHVIRAAEGSLRTKLKQHQDWTQSVDESKEQFSRVSSPEMKALILEDLKNRMRISEEMKEEANRAQIKYDDLVAENKETYSRAEDAAVRMRRWFEENTKLP